LCHPASRELVTEFLLRRRSVLDSFRFHLYFPQHGGSASREYDPSHIFTDLGGRESRLTSPENPVRRGLIEWNGLAPSPLAFSQTQDSEDDQEVRSMLSVSVVLKYPTHPTFGYNNRSRTIEMPLIYDACCDAPSLFHATLPFRSVVKFNQFPA
jgi:hypothetical protein